MNRPARVSNGDFRVTGWNAGRDRELLSYETGFSRGAPPLTTPQGKQKLRSPLFLHPAIFIPAWVAVGSLFALQSYFMERTWGYHVALWTTLLAWGVQFLIWGIISQLLWWRLGEWILQANLKTILTRVVPLSVAASVLEEAIWVACFPHFPMHRTMTYPQRLLFYLDSELIDNMVIFWVAFGLFRGVGYYQKYREKEYTAVSLENELSNAQLRALRMQLNPHFLFNAMNSISSLMRLDVDTADQMLEQISSMLRMSLDRGDAKLIPLADEIEFIQLFLSIQKMRFRETVYHYVAIEPDVLDAMVPTMILQPIVENAYLHGVAKTRGQGFLGIEAQNYKGELRICVRNSGRGLAQKTMAEPGRCGGVGISNVKSRLELHYGDSQRFTLTDFPDGEVQAVLLLPLSYEPRLNGSTAEYLYENQNHHSG
jgi:two-component system LytT family sensor kinase